jgi:hypothetical protein
MLIRPISRHVTPRRFLMRWIRLLLVPLLFASCTEANPAAPDIEVSPLFAAAEVGWTEGVGFEEYTYPVPCLGEDLHFAGSFWYRYHSVVNDKREIWLAQYGMLPDYHGVGLTTGHLWLAKPSTVQGISRTDLTVGTPGEPFQVSRLTLALFDFVNQTTGETLSWPMRIHLSRNAAGEVKVNLWVEPCRVK